MSLAGGKVVVTDQVDGSGDRVVKHASTVDIAYEAHVVETGRRIDRATRHQPYTFTVGGPDVIPGLSLGVRGMRIGGLRTITVSHELAYGAKGRRPAVPPKATLKFDVELLDIGAGFAPPR